MKDATRADDQPELSLEESNNQRIQALNAIGVGIAGVNEALLMRMMEHLLGPVEVQRVHQEHQEWLAETLTSMEEQVLAQQRKQSLHLPRRGH